MSHLRLALLAAGAFVVVFALLYGSTMTLRARDGVQPIEFMDEAFYSILGADLATSGAESIYGPSGFAEVDGLPDQSWYHWGEIWLAAALIDILGAGALEVRHLIVLPVLLLAAATLSGTIVRRFSRSPSSGAFLVGFVACISMAPIPLLPGPHFSFWAVGMMFGITQYGMGAIAALTVIYSIAILPSREPRWPLVIFVSSTAAFLLPAHLVIAGLALIGGTTVLAAHAAREWRTRRRLPSLAPVWRRLMRTTLVALSISLLWGNITGHGIGGSGLSTSVAPFNNSWQASLAIATLGAGAFMAIPVAWKLVRPEMPLQVNLYLATTVLLLAGAIAWGARLGDFNMFHAFFGGMAVFAPSAASVAIWTLWARFRETARRPLALIMIVGFVVQAEIGFGIGVARLIRFGPVDYDPVPVEILAEIRAIPKDSKVAYSCQPNEELAYWDSRLLGISAHTGRRIVSMCFQSEALVRLIGTELYPDVESPLFRTAPQRELYPTASARPSSAEVSAFLSRHGIDYIYADADHPNLLDPAATPVAEVGAFQLLRVP